MIKDIHVSNSQLTFTDNTLTTPATIPINKIDFQAINFDMNGKNDFKIRALFPEGGNVRFDWKGDINDLSNQQIMLNVRNLSLRLLSPVLYQIYCL